MERDSVFADSAVFGSSEVVSKGGAEEERVERRSSRGSAAGVAIMPTNWYRERDVPALDPADAQTRWTHSS